MGSTAVPPGGHVLITGVNGFLASHLALQLIGRGFAVKGTVRTPEKGEWITEAIKARYPNGKFEAILVPSLSTPGALDDHVKQVDGVAYMVADTSLNSDPSQVIVPGLQALQFALESAAKSPSVKRFVFTSSYTAAVDTSVPAGPEVLVTQDSWNETCSARARASPPYDPMRALDIYQTLKIESERTFWKFGGEEEPRFVQNSVLPGFVIGSIVHSKQRGSTSALVKAYFDDPTSNQGLAWITAPWVVDVVDSALLHVAALTDTNVRNERLLAMADPFHLASFGRAFQGIDPTRSWPEAGLDETKEGATKWVADTKRPAEILRLFGQDEGFTPFLESVRRTCLESDPAWKFCRESFLNIE